MPERTGIKEIVDLGALSALAHPRRQRILEQLGLHGPATSAMLARALDLNTGATSYHVRQLVRYGFVAETTGRGDGRRHARERWWRAVPADLRFPTRSTQDEQTRTVVDEMNRIAFAADFDLFERSQRATAGEKSAWVDGFPYSRGSIRVTLPELLDFFEEFIGLINRYKHSAPEPDPAGDATGDLAPAPDDGRRTVLTRFLGFPAPEVPPPSSRPGPASAPVRDLP
jgi:DNA-binding transcriptional ArsR family regulator